MDEDESEFCPNCLEKFCKCEGDGSQMAPSDEEIAQSAYGEGE